MKKWTVALLGMILALGITACGKENAADNGSAAANEAANQGAVNAAANTAGDETAVPTADELLTKAMDASEQLKSFSMEANISQNIAIAQGDAQQEQKVDITMQVDYVKEPLGMYQVMNMSLGDQGSQNIEQYITKDNIFSKVDGTWVEIPSESRDALIQELEQSASPEVQLEQFKSIAGESAVVLEGDEYILSAELSGDGLKELAKTLLSQSGGEDEQTMALLEQMNIESIKISNAFNKDTYLPTKSSVDIVMDMEAEGQKISLNMVMDTKYSKFNEVAEIEVPQEALDSVQ
ncbi:DUF6612 family protein [Paenibacillus sp. M1]|uniref:DUF6612 family protein n=1 Tax=Paenibacillus haidiansis TaxID=1574488 RepID=A0ABU7VV94_9BACL